MKVAFVADVHVGNHRRHGGAVEAGLNQRCRAAVDVLHHAKRRARELDAPFVVLGDLFDTTRPEPQVITAVQHALSGVETYLLMGNHDQYSVAPGDHALGPLDGFSMTEVIEKPGIVDFNGVELWAVPFRPGDARVWLPEVMRTSFQNTQPPKVRVLCLHLGLIDDDTPPYLKDAHDAVPVDLVGELAERYGIRYAVAGNWHARRLWSMVEPRVHVMQVGALVPTGWDNPGLEGYGTLAILDSEAGTLTYEELTGPRFVKTRTVEEAYEVAGEAKRLGHQLYLQMVAPPDQLASTLALLDIPGLAAVEVVPDAAQSEQAARSAADAARSGETLGTALGGFVEEMKLEEGVDRAAVLRRARGYLWVDDTIAALKESDGT